MRSYGAIKAINTVAYVLIVVLFSWLQPNCSTAQSPNLGVPLVDNFEKQDYGFGPDNWDIESYGEHITFANSGGLLLYNGKNWIKYTTPLNTVLRSISVHKDTIWTGGQGELGYFSPDESGQLYYTSIVDEHYLKDQNLMEVLNLQYLHSTLYYNNSNTHVHAITNGSFTQYGSGGLITEIAIVNDQVWYAEFGKGLYAITDSGVSSKVVGSTQIRNYVVNDILEFGNKVLVLTERNGIWIYQNNTFIPWDNNAEDYFKEKFIKCGSTNHDNNLLVGTKLGGIVIINENGKAIQVLNKKQGLLNNETNHIHISERGTIRIASNNGIDQFTLEQGHSVFYPDGELQGAVYDVKRWNRHLFFCTSNGLYSIEEKQYYNPFEKNSFKLIDGTIGQAWGLDIIDDQLFLGHQSGAYQVMSDFSIKLLLNEGTWKYVPLADNTIAIGTYTGVYVMKNQGDKWEMVSKIPGLSESSRIMIYDNDQNLWISHPYKKVYRINFNEDFSTSILREYDKTSGLTTDKRNYVYDINGECIVTNETGVYLFNSASDEFERFTMMDTITNLHVKRFIPHNKEGQYWAIASDGTRLLDITKDNLIKVNTYISQNQIDQSDYIGGFENLYPIADNSILMCTIKGVSKIQSNDNDIPESKPYFTSITIPSKGDSLLYGGFNTLEPLILDNKCKDIRFDFVGPINPNKSYQYSYKLEGVDNDWSFPSAETMKEYNNLTHGDYTFLLRTIGPNGQTSETTRSQFTIATPWYRSIVANLIYAILFLAFLAGLLFIPRQQYQKSTAILESEKKNTELEMEQLKKATDLELETIKREKLENEILFKNKELAMSTMHLLQKNETLTAIRTEVEKVASKIKDPDAKKEVRKIVSLLRNDDRVEDDWDNFSIHFDQANHNFLKRLKKEFPVLTPKDQKLCAYLRMNLTTKDIAPLLNISVRGVEIARYRLRKKINLDKEINLNSFMMDY